MSSIFNFFKYIHDQFGPVAAFMFILVIILSSILIYLFKNFPDILMESLKKRDDIKHTDGARARKEASVEITKSLSNLVLECKVDRAVLFEYSNGTSNIAGLPFLFINSTYESLDINSSSICPDFQRVNSSILANFIFKLEEHSYFYFKDIESIKEEHNYLYSLLKKNDVKSALFYAIYNDTGMIGYIGILSHNEFEREDTLPQVAEEAQRVSSLLYYNENRRGK